MIQGSLPPNSNKTVVPTSAAFIATNLPTSSEPMNVI